MQEDSTNKKNIDWRQLIIFLNKINKLKKIKRYNYQESRLNESVADHCWRLALMVCVIGDFLDMKIDKTYAMQLALIHDLGESICGDIDFIKIIRNEVSLEEKYELEKKAWQQLQEFLPENLSQTFFDMWLDFEEQKSLEAKFVAALDRLEGSLHIMDIGCNEHADPDLIPNSCDKHLDQVPQLFDFLKTLKQMQKQEFQQLGLLWKDEYDDFNGWQNNNNMQSY